MTDFKDSLKRGLAAHRSRTQAQEDLDELLKVATEDASSILGTQLKIMRGVAISTRRQAVSAMDVMKGRSTGSPVTGIVAQLGGRNAQLLAELTFSDLGYPITMRVREKTFTAHDKKGLEMLLSDVLAEPSVGAVLARMSASD